MNRYLLPLLVLALCVISSCRKDDLEITDTNINPNLDLVYESLLYGIVANKENIPIEDALVQLGNKSVPTDVNGFYAINNAELSKEGSLVTVQKDGYFTTYKFATSIENKARYLKVVLVKDDPIKNFDSSTATMVDLNGGAQIEFKANSIVNENGTPYDGPVNVSAHYYDPGDFEIPLTMPGDLRGISKDGLEVQLATFGMMAIEIKDDNQNLLQIAEGQTAKLVFPLEGAFESQAASQIPLWSLDEETGIWIEEGIATLESGSYVAHVEHFSFWNCDEPFPLVEISGRIVNQDGEALKNQSIIISVDGTLQCGYGFSDDDGYFIGKVPRDQDLLIGVRLCEELENVSISALSTDSDVGTISFNTLDYEVDISARITDCFDNGLENVYVIIETNEDRNALVLQDDGVIAAQAFGCGTDDILLKAYHASSMQSTPVTQIDPSINPAQLGDIKLCDGDQEFFSWSFNQGPIHFINELDVFIIDDEELYIRGSDALQQISVALHGTYNDGVFEDFIVYSLLNYAENNNDPEDYAFCKTDCDLDFEIKETDDGNDLVFTGRIEGYMHADTNDLESIFVESQFQCKLDRRFDMGSISGQVWHDDDKDGIKDPDEKPIPGIYLRPNSTDAPPGFNNFNTTTDENGNYHLANVVPDATYELIYFPPSNGYELSPSNVGPEETDNDFTQNINQFESTIIIADGEDLVNHDLGMSSTELLCNSTSRSGCVPEINVRFGVANGLPPYTYKISSGQSSTDGSFVLSEGGAYSVTITDCLGKECIRTHNIDAYSTYISCTPYIDSDTGTPGVWDSSDEKLENMQIQVLDEQGDVYTTIQYNPIAKSYWVDNIEPGDYRIRLGLPSDLEVLPLGDPDQFNDNDLDPLTNITINKTLECDRGLGFYLALKRK